MMQLFMVELISGTVNEGTIMRYGKRGELMRYGKRGNLMRYGKRSEDTDEDVYQNIALGYRYGNRENDEDMEHNFKRLFRYKYSFCN